MTAAGTSPQGKRSEDAPPPLMLGGPAALAESEWMGVARDLEAFKRGGRPA